MKKCIDCGGGLPNNKKIYCLDCSEKRRYDREKERKNRVNRERRENERHKT